ncbi:MAG TPA: galactokinase [Chloroflexi bacterium]|nr:galactokinase [Chloroflexota bacterium]
MEKETAPYGRVAAQFEKSYGRPPAIVVAAPGRVNLIGEHTDYNEGYVLPVAVDRYILVAAGPRRDRKVSFQALNLGEEDAFSLDEIDRGERGWSNYGRGVAWEMERAGHRLQGMEAVIWGDLPMKSGLGSSAALEVAVAYSFQLLSNLEIEPLQLALLCQGAENGFVGVQCGLMDQMTSALGERDRALLIDCRSLDHQLIPVPPEVDIVVADTGRRRGLLDSQYNLRRQECQEGARLLGVPSLRSVSPQELAERRSDLPPSIYRRVRHVVTENQRTLEAAEALRGDLEAFGRLMYDSHHSLGHDFEVSCPELDILVEAARKVSGVYGSRLTGAGFGGCTVSLVTREAVPEFQALVTKEYEKAMAKKPAIYVCRPAQGVSKCR